MEGTKKCTKCGEVKQFQCFSKAQKGRFGLQPSCKECVAINFQNNKEKYKATQKEYYKKNKSKIDSYKIEWDRQNRERIRLRFYERRGYPKIVRVTFIGDVIQRRRESKKRYRDANKDKAKKYTLSRINDQRVIDLRRQRKKKYVDQMSDFYIKDNLKRKMGFTSEEIERHPELIEIKKIIIQTKRLCKKSQN